MLLDLCITLPFTLLKVIYLIWFELSRLIQIAQFDVFGTLIHLHVHCLSFSRFSESDSIMIFYMLKNSVVIFSFVLPRVVSLTLKVLFLFIYLLTAKWHFQGNFILCHRYYIFPKDSLNNLNLIDSFNCWAYS